MLRSPVVRIAVASGFAIISTSVSAESPYTAERYTGLAASQRIEAPFPVPYPLELRVDELRVELDSAFISGDRVTFFEKCKPTLDRIMLEGGDQIPYASLPVQLSLVDMLNKVGMGLFGTGRLPDAEGYFVTAIAVKKNPVSYYRLGMLYAERASRLNSTTQSTQMIMLAQQSIDHFRSALVLEQRPSYRGFLKRKIKQIEGIIEMAPTNLNSA